MGGAPVARRGAAAPHRLGDPPFDTLFLRRRDPGDKPFFLMTSYVRPHAPYDAPQAFFDMYKDKELTPPIRGDWDDESALRAHGREFNNIYGSSDPEQIRAQQVGYYACITHIDYQIGRLIQTLTDDGSLSDTIIMFISDHGEMLSDHCFIRKSLPYRGSANSTFHSQRPGRTVRRCEPERGRAARRAAHAGRAGRRRGA